MKAPIYVDHGRTYHADSCEELRKAAAGDELDFSALCRGSYPGRKIPDKKLRGICSVGFWDAAHAQNWGLGWHRNEGIELTWLETGSLDFTLESGNYPLHPGDLTITRPWQPHKIGEPHVNAGRLHWLILDIGVRQPHQEWRWPDWIVLTKEDIVELTDFLRRNEQPVWTLDNETARCFWKITECSRHEIDDVASKLIIYINELLLNLLEMFRSQRVNLSAALTTARRSTELFLNSLKHNSDDQWTLETMAAGCGLGITRFVHYCKEITNLSPMQYLNQLRLEKAAHLLVASPEKSVTDIAFQCGFSSSQYFATLFRQKYRCTPGTYRKTTKCSICNP
jgi:AraC-like DNA-binding protein